MKRFFAGLFCAVGSALLIIGLLILSVEAFAVNQSFFNAEYSKCNTAKNIEAKLGMRSDYLPEVTKTLLDYTTGSRDSLDMKADFNGVQREVFDQREKDHMVDVKALYLKARDVRTYCLGGAAVLFLLAFLLRGGKAFKTLCGAFLRVSGVFVVVIAVIAIYAAVDFNSFWVSFHHVFFTNELWQLFPDTEVLINMVPEQFFSDLVTNIIICFVSIFAALNAVALAGSLIIKRREVRKAGGL